MNNDRQIKFKYIFDENYNPVYCNGAYGGVSPQGEIVANFYLERLPLPYSYTNAVNPDGSLGGTVETDPSDLNDFFIRYVSTGIVLSENSARAIHSWLGKQIEELENRNNTKIEVVEEYKEGAGNEE